MALVLTLLVGVIFGAADQQLGSVTGLGLWTSTVAQVSAPWIVLPFVVGMTQKDQRRAMLFGLVFTEAALLGYFAMTYSPFEIHPWSIDRFAQGMVAITTRGWFNPAFILIGLLTRPVFGLLGHHWNARRWWVSAVSVVGALCLEPLARWAVGHLSPPGAVWTAEVFVGAVVAGLFARELVIRRRGTVIGSRM